MASKEMVGKVVKRVFAKYPGRVPGFAGGIDTVIEDWENGYRKIPDEKLGQACTQFVLDTESINSNDCPFAMIRTLAFSLMENKASGFIAPSEKIPDAVCEEGLKKVREIMAKLSGAGRLALSDDIEERRQKQLAALRT